MPASPSSNGNGSSPGKDVVLPATDQDVRLGESVAEKARLCIRAAELRAQHKSFAVIATELHLASPAVAQKAVRTGLTLIPAEDVSQIRALADQRFDRIARGLLEIIEAPGPLVSQGKIMMNEEDPDGPPFPYPDQMVRTRAYEALLKTYAEQHKMHGANAPARRITMSADMLAAHLAQLKAEQLAAGGGREALQGQAEAAG